MCTKACNQLQLGPLLHSEAMDALGVHHQALFQRAGIDLPVKRTTQCGLPHSITSVDMQPWRSQDCTRVHLRTRRARREEARAGISKAPLDGEGLNSGLISADNFYLWIVYAEGERPCATISGFGNSGSVAREYQQRLPILHREIKGGPCVGRSDRTLPELHCFLAYMDRLGDKAVHDKAESQHAPALRPRLKLDAGGAAAPRPTMTGLMFQSKPTIFKAH